MSTEQFIQALEENAPLYEVELEGHAIANLRAYFEIVQAWNARLHLVAPCSPAEFATRHVLESTLAVPHIGVGAHVADIGSGAGFPVIPCLILRTDIRATLIEASQKKAIFLREALSATGLKERAEIVAARFERTSAPDANVITCRALERFTASLSKILTWSPPDAKLILFGGPALQAEIEKAKLAYTSQRIPDSEQRFVFIINK
jgi:16S rRNA (guanine527-N7)-methyltransferase